MSILNHYINMWKNAFDFSGKTDRPGYWWAVLLNFIVSSLVSCIGTAISAPVLANIYGLLVLIPELSLCVRRLRDAGKGWGWMFINLIPLVGWIVFIVMLCQPSLQEAEPAEA